MSYSELLSQLRGDFEAGSLVLPELQELVFSVHSEQGDKPAERKESRLQKLREETRAKLLAYLLDACEYGSMDSLDAVWDQVRSLCDAREQRALMQGRNLEGCDQEWPVWRKRGLPLSFALRNRDIGHATALISRLLTLDESIGSCSLDLTDQHGRCEVMMHCLQFNFGRIHSSGSRSSECSWTADCPCRTHRCIRHSVLLMRQQCTLISEDNCLSSLSECHSVSLLIVLCLEVRWFFADEKRAQTLIRQVRRARLRRLSKVESFEYKRHCAAMLDVSEDVSHSLSADIQAAEKGDHRWLFDLMDLRFHRLLQSLQYLPAKGVCKVVFCLNQSRTRLRKEAVITALRCHSPLLPVLIAVINLLCFGE